MSSSKCCHFFCEMKKFKSENLSLKDEITDLRKELENYSRLLSDISKGIRAIDTARKDSYYKELMTIQRKIKDKQSFIA